MNTLEWVAVGCAGVIVIAMVASAQKTVQGSSSNTSSSTNTNYIGTVGSGQGTVTSPQITYITSSGQTTNQALTYNGQGNTAIQTNTDGSITTFGSAQTLASAEQVIFKNGTASQAGNGTLASPYQLNSKGNIVWQGVGEYTTALGTDLVTNQAFVTSYNSNVVNGTYI